MKNTKLIYTDAKSSTMVIYDQKFEDGYCFLSGTAISSEGISEIEVEPFEFNLLSDMDALMKEVNWKEIDKTPTSKIITFNVLNGKYSAKITPSKNEKIHHVEIMKPNGETQVLTTYDNIATVVALAIIAGTVCLGTSTIHALLLNKKCPEGTCFKLRIKFNLRALTGDIDSECNPCEQEK